MVGILDTIAKLAEGRRPQTKTVELWIKGDQDLRRKVRRVIVEELVKMGFSVPHQMETEKPATPQDESIYLVLERDE